MKILQLLHFPLRGAGAGVYVDLLCRALQASGHSIRAICSDNSDRPARRYSVRSVQFQLGGVSKPGFPVFSSHPLSAGPRFGSLSRSDRRLYISELQRVVLREISRFDPDILHVHHGWVLGDIASSSGKPYLLTLHGTERMAFRRAPAYGPGHLKGIRGAARIIVSTSDEERLAAETYDVAPGRITVLPPAIDSARFRPMNIDRRRLLRRHGLAKYAERPVVLFAGRLTAQKGVGTLIRAAAMYSGSRPEPLTLIVGDGEDRRSLERLAASLNIESLRFLGLRPHSEMPALMNLANIVVVPSRREPFGLSAVEAMACGARVVASRIGGLRHPILAEVDGVNGMVRPNDPIGLAARISQLIAVGVKRETRRQMAFYSRNQFGIDRHLRRIEALYAEACGGAPAVRRSSASGR